MTRKQIRVSLIIMIALALFLVPSGARLQFTTPVDYGPSTRTPEPTFTPEPTAAPTATPEPTPSPTPSTYETLRKKDAGTKPEQVKRLQTRLRELGYFSGVIDGYFGNETFDALVSFQRVNGLQGDGIAGQETQRLMYEDSLVLDATGRIYISADSVAVTPRPSATPALKVRALPMDDFSCGPRPLSDYFISSGYRDDSIRLELSSEEVGGGLITCALVSVHDASQLRSAVGGSLEAPASAPLSAIADHHRAVIAIAGDDYPLVTGYEARQGFVLSDRSEGTGDLLTVDKTGLVRVFTALGRENGLELVGDQLYLAYSGGKALLINGIQQGDLDADRAQAMTAFGQLDDGRYIIVSTRSGEENASAFTPAALADYMAGKGCMQAYLMSSGDPAGVYYAGGMISDGNSSPRRVFDILYFASGRIEQEG